MFMGLCFILLRTLKLECFPILHFVVRRINNVFELVSEEVQRFIMWYTL